jgi:hypothetical protein
MKDLLLEAANFARITGRDDKLKGYWIASIGIRYDGVVIKSANAGVRVAENSIAKFREIPLSHSEVRTLRKMDCGGILCVARTLRIKNLSLQESLRISRPCLVCRNHIKSKRIKKVYYTISPYEYGVWYPSNDREEIYNF